jgi:membrane protease subunit (stomatin/prohibitin family)
MKAAASNPSGAMMGFMGMGMAQQAGGMNAQNLFAMGNQQNAGMQAQSQQQNSSQASASTSNSWTCKCGTQNSGKFCTNCAAPKPSAPSQWTCSCGTNNTGKFCYNCGKPAPSVQSFRCDKCGWEPSNPAQPPKFCPECGDVFDDKDKN